MRFVHTIIVVNDSIAQIYLTRFPDKPVFSIYNAPWTKQFQRSDIIQEELKLSEDARVFLYQGGLVPGRGIPLLLEAFSKLQHKNFVLVFMGYGELASLIETYTSTNTNIFLLKAVSPDKLLDYTQSCDYGVSIIENTCLSYYYSLPNKVLEYIMCRKPVIVSNLPEMSSIVLQHQIGLVLEDFSVDAVSDAIKKMVLLDENIVSERISQMIHKYTWEHQETKLINAYQQLLKRS